MKRKSILTLILLILSGCCLLFSIMTMLGNDDPGGTETVGERNIEPDPDDQTTGSSSGSEKNTESQSGTGNSLGTGNSDGTGNPYGMEKSSGTGNVSGTGNSGGSTNTGESPANALRLPDDVPEYSGKPYYELTGNVPLFNEKEKTSTDSFENYSDLDLIGRAGVAFANLSPELMPTEERGPIGQIRPSGWHTVKYNDLIDGNYLYNRCHLIAYSLAGENANEKNLITGTRYLNVEGMQPFEEEVLDYISRTRNHVLYRVTPVYAGNNPLVSGVEMEAWSVEDQGKGVSFHVYCYNVQPGIVIDYTTGESRRTDGKPVDTENSSEESSAKNAENKTETKTAETTSGNTGNASSKNTEKNTDGLVPDNNGKVITPGDETTGSGNNDRNHETKGSDNNDQNRGTTGSDNNDQNHGTKGSGQSDSSSKETAKTYILNTNTKKIHRPTCQSVSEMKAKNKKEVTSTIEELKEKGYAPCKRCLKGY